MQAGGRAGHASGTGAAALASGGLHRKYASKSLLYDGDIGVHLCWLLAEPIEERQDAV